MTNDRQPTDWIADAEKAGADLRVQITRAHEAFQMLKQERREIEELKRDLPRLIDKIIMTAIDRALRERLGELEIQTNRAMRHAVETIEREFDRLKNLFLTGTEDGTGDGLDSAVTLLNAVKLLEKQSEANAAQT